MVDKRQASGGNTPAWPWSSLDGNLLSSGSSDSVSAYEEAQRVPGALIASNFDLESEAVSLKGTKKVSGLFVTGM